MLDTQIIVWFAFSDPRLPARVRDKIETHQGALHVSFASALEYGIKRARYPQELHEPFERLLMPDYCRLDMSFALHRFAEDLPRIHRDPFDRMLIAQALALDLTFVTSDKMIRNYPVSTYW